MNPLIRLVFGVIVHAILDEAAAWVKKQREQPPTTPAPPPPAGK